MKRIFCFCCTAILLSFAGCKKKNECWYTYYPIPLQISFAGFAASEIDSIYIDQYEANGQFDQPIRRDTIYYGRFTIINGALVGDSVTYSTNSYADGLMEGQDYQITFAGTGERFRIAEIFYEKGYAWTREDAPCLSRGGYTGPSKVVINGNEAKGYTYSPPDNPSYQPAVAVYFTLRK